MERGTLPDNFAEEVMDLEFSIEDNNFQVGTVDRLVYLYSQAMEYYEGYDNDKYIRFKDRISRLLMRPTVFSKMNNPEKVETKPKEEKAQEEETKPKKVSEQARMKKKELEISALSQVDVNKTAILHNHRDGQKKMKRAINKDLGQQNVSLKRRLEERRKTNKGGPNRPLSRCYSNLSHDMKSFAPDLSSIQGEESKYTEDSTIQSIDKDEKNPDSFVDELGQLGIDDIQINE